MEKLQPQDSILAKVESFDNSPSIEAATGWCSALLLSAIGISFLVSLSLYGWTNSSIGSLAAAVLLYGTWFIEFGMTLTMLHILFLLPASQPARILPGIAGGVLVGTQITFATRGYGLLPFLGAVLAFTILGWLLQRITGLSLTLRGTPAYRSPLGTRFFLILPAVLIALGLIPIVMTSLFGGARHITSSSIIYYGLSTTAVCVFPLLLLYAALGSFHLRREARVVLGAVALIILVGSIVLSSVQPWMVFVPWLISYVGFFIAGVYLAYWPFQRYGFRIVRAKRALISARDLEVSFDEIE